VKKSEKLRYISKLSELQNQIKPADLPQGKGTLIVADWVGFIDGNDAVERRKRQSV
jgi:hypothetical protein